jgi:hypothetical protein
MPEEGTFDEKAFVASALRRGEQYRLEGKISAASASAVGFRQALALARNRGLTNYQPMRAKQSRDEFAAEIRAVVELAMRIGQPTKTAGVTSG